VEVFGEAGRHTRAAVGMAELPLDIGSGSSSSRGSGERSEVHSLFVGAGVRRDLLDQ